MQKRDEKGKAYDSCSLEKRYDLFLFFFFECNDVATFECEIFLNKRLCYVVVGSFKVPGVCERRKKRKKKAGFSKRENGCRRCRRVEKKSKIEIERKRVGLERGRN